MFSSLNNDDSGRTRAPVGRGVGGIPLHHRMRHRVAPLSPAPPPRRAGYARTPPPFLPPHPACRSLTGRRLPHESVAHAPCSARLRCYTRRRTGAGRCHWPGRGSRSAIPLSTPPPASPHLPPSPLRRGLRAPRAGFSPLAPSPSAALPRPRRRFPSVGRRVLADCTGRAAAAAGQGSCGRLPVSPPALPGRL